MQQLQREAIDKWKEFEEEHNIDLTTGEELTPKLIMGKTCTSRKNKETRSKFTTKKFKEKKDND